jgi:hypothetical protein
MDEEGEPQRDDPESSSRRDEDNWYHVALKSRHRHTMPKKHFAPIMQVHGGLVIG